MTATLNGMNISWKFGVTQYRDLSESTLQLSPRDRPGEDMMKSPLTTSFCLHIAVTHIHYEALLALSALFGTELHNDSLLPSTLMLPPPVRSSLPVVPMSMTMDSTIDVKLEA